MREAFTGAFAPSDDDDGWVGCTCLEAWKVVKKTPIKIIPEIFWLYFLDI